MYMFLKNSPVAAVNTDASEAAAKAAELRDQLQMTRQQVEQLQIEHTLLAEQRHQSKRECLSLGQNKCNGTNGIQTPAQLKRVTLRCRA